MKFCCLLALPMWFQMIRFSEFTFVHIPKTAGLWITDILKRHFVVEAEHHPHMMPFVPQDKPIIAVTRDPASWWESWIAWGRNYPDKDPYYSAVMERNDMRNINQIVTDYVARMPEIERGTPLPFIACMAAQKIGPLTARIRELDGYDVRWVQFENLREGWIQSLTELGVITDQLRADITTMGAYNETPKEHKETLTVDISALEPRHG